MNLLSTLLLSYVHRRCRRGLEGIFAFGLDRARAHVGREPLIFASNHVSWWDPMALLVVRRALTLSRGYGLMRADNLRRLPFFRALGALPLDTRDRRRGVRDLRAAARVLQDPGDGLWIFAQGEQRRPSARPIDVKRGVSALARLSGARVLPVAIDLRFGDEPVPQFVFNFGAPLDDTSTLANALEQLVDDAMHRSVSTAEVVLGGARQNPERGVGARLLGART